MKLFCKILPPEDIQKRIKHLEHLDLSLFIESLPQTQDDLSEINILVLIEPNGYFGHCDWAIKNKDLWQTLDSLNAELSVNWQWIKAHIGNIYNEMADSLAREAASKRIINNV